MKYQLFTNASMTIVCNIRMICLELNWLFYDPSWMLQLSEFVWTLCSSLWVFFNNFFLIDATDRSKTSSDQKCLFFAVRLYPLSFFANTPFKFVVLDLTSVVSGMLVEEIMYTSTHLRYDLFLSRGVAGDYFLT